MVRVWHTKTGRLLMSLQSWCGEMSQAVSSDNTPRQQPAAAGGVAAAISAALDVVLGSGSEGQLPASAGYEESKPPAWVVGVWFVRSPTGGESPGDALGAFGDGVQLLAAATADQAVVLWDIVTGNKVRAPEGANGSEIVLDGCIQARQSQ